MIRASKHRIDQITNQSKIDSIDSLLIDFKICLEYYIELIVKGELPLKTNLSSKLLPIFNIKNARYRQLIYKHASEIIRSNIKKSSNKRYARYKKIYKYFAENERQVKFTDLKYSELNLKNIVTSKYFILPKINNLTINLDERFFDVKNGVHFDEFINIKLSQFNDRGTRLLQVNIPLKQHNHSNTLKSKGFKLKNTIQLKSINNKIYINLIWFKEDTEIKSSGNSLGVDLGYKKLISTSRGEFIGEEMFELYRKISNKKQGSKNFKQLLTHRDNMINHFVKKLDLDNINCLFIEDLLNVKHKSKLNRKINNKLQRWSYLKTISKLERICQEKGVKVEKVSPAYTSQTCSSCGVIDKSSRNLEDFNCTSCGYKIDADFNAAINILNRGIYSSSNAKKDKCHNFS